VQQAPTISPDGFWMWNGAQWVPNPERQPTVVSAPRPYESARLRASAATILLVANIFGLALYSAFDLVDIAYLGTKAPSDAFSLAEGLTALAAIAVYYGTFIAAAVLFLMWLHRVVRNMPALGSADPRWSPARAVVYCFIPIVNLAHPLLSTLDAWRGSDPSRRSLDLAARRALGTPQLFVWWWIAWLTGNVVSNIAARSDSTAGDWADIASNVLLAAAAVCAVAIVRQVTARQDSKNELIANGQLT
jgi:Domain of unknown function (DUF4328)